MINTNTVTIADRNAWKDTVRALYQYQRRDHSDFVSGLQETYPKTWQQRQLRVIPFLWRVCRELATLYRTPARRTWIGEGLGPEIQLRLLEIYRDLDVDRKMAHLQETLVACNNAVLLVWPKEEGLRLLVVPPYDVELKLSDPVSNDPRDISEAWINLPVGSDTKFGLTSYGTCHITASTATWTEGPRDIKGRGVFNDAGTNPLGRIPLLLLKGESAPGEIWACPNEDLLLIQRSLNFSYTEIAHTASFQGFGQPVLTGTSYQAAANLELGPESVIALPDSEMSFSYVSGNPPIQAAQASLDAYLHAMIAHVGLNPAQFMKHSLTAVAKQIDAQERDEERARYAMTFERAEQELYELIRLGLAVTRGGGSQIYAPANVRASFGKPAELIVDPLHKAQAHRMAIEDGLESTVSIMMKENNISRRAAERRIKQNLADTVAIRAAVDPDQRVAQGRSPSSELELVPGGGAAT